MFQNSAPLIISKVTNKVVYTFLNQPSIVPKCIARWNNVVEIDITEWSLIFKLIECTQERKLQSFQYKILHRIFPCNKYVSKWDKNVNEKCNQCESVDTIEHYFLQCSTVSNFWKRVQNWWESNFEQIFAINMKIVIFGDLQNSCVQKCKNFVIMQAKWYIHKQKMNKSEPYFMDFLSRLKNAVEIEKIIYIRNNKINLFQDTFGQMEINL